MPIEAAAGNQSTVTRVPMDCLICTLILLYSIQSQLVHSGLYNICACVWIYDNGLVIMIK